MQVHQSYITDAISEGKRIFIIPPYQRRYSWTRENCQRLFDDILEASDGEEHFLGTICYKSRRQSILIDGQQRITTIMLFICALSKCAPELADDMKRCLYVGGRFSTLEDSLRLRPSREDSPAWQRIVLTGDSSGDTRMDDNYNYFIELIKSVEDPSALWKALDSMTIVELEIQNEHPQEIFESLNSTGMSLTNADRIRNLMLMGNESLYQLWAPIENLGDELETFLTHFIIDSLRSDQFSYGVTRYKINAHTLYRIYCSYLKTHSREEVIRSMVEYMKYYMPYVKMSNEIQDWDYAPLAVFNAQDSRIAFVYIDRLFEKGKISEDDRATAHKAILSFIVRSRACGHSGMSAQFACSFIRHIDINNFVPSMWKSITGGKGTMSMPNDMEFIDAISNSDIYKTLRSAGTKYLLYSLEKFGPFPRGLPEYEDGEISIEHIAPQKSTSQWKDCEGKHHLGNLALTSENSRMSNKNFEYKKKFYKNEKFYYTREIAAYDSWDDGTIESRGKRLAKIALDIWNIPAEYQHKKAPFYTLESKTSYSFTRPSMVSIYGDARTVSRWSEMIPAVISILAGFDSDVIRRVLSSRKDVTLTEHDGYSPVDDFFIKTRRSADDTIRAVRSILQEYDYIADTAYTDSLRFSLANR